MGLQKKVNKLSTAEILLLISPLFWYIAPLKNVPTCVIVVKKNTTSKISEYFDMCNREIKFILLKNC